MKKFYLYRYEDIHGKSGVGVVAGGVIFDNGMAAMSWNSNVPTVTTYAKITDVELLHGHEGRTVVVIEGREDHLTMYNDCKEIVRKNKKIKDKLD
jgi:hypothetical protein